MRPALGQRMGVAEYSPIRRVTAGQPRLGQNCTGVPDFQTAFLATLPKKTIKTHPKRLPAAEVQTLTYWGKIFFPNMLVICLNTPHSTS